MFYLLFPFGFLYAVVWRRPRVRVIITTPTGKVLLVKTWLGRQRWGFPGGGVARSESFEHAAVREVYEETGLRLTEQQLAPRGDEWAKEGVPMHLYFYIATVEEELLPDIAKKYQLEIFDRSWFPQDALPDDVSPVVRCHI